MEQTEVDLEDCLEQRHVGTLIQSDLMLPHVDDETLCARHREEGTLSLEVLILSPLPAICSLDVHDQDIHCLATTHPDSLCRLLTSRLVHDVERGAEQFVEKGGLTRRLATEDGTEVVAEAGVLETPLRETVVELRGEFLVFVD